MQIYAYKCISSIQTTIKKKLQLIDIVSSLLFHPLTQYYNNNKINYIYFALLQTHIRNN